MTKPKLKRFIEQAIEESKIRLKENRPLYFTYQELLNDYEENDIGNEATMKEFITEILKETKFLIVM